MATAMLSTVVLRWMVPFTGAEPVVFAKTAITTTAITTAVWMSVTLLTRPEPEEVLLRFYRKVRPDVRGWRAVSRLAPEVFPVRDLGRNLISWVLGCAMGYLALFAVGRLAIGPRWTGALMLLASAVCAFFLYLNLARGGWQAEPMESEVRSTGHAVPSH
jgi:hypothetical protein